MRILSVSTVPYLPQSYGGAETSIHDLAISLSRSGHLHAVMAALRAGDRTWLRNRIASRVLGGRSFPMDRSLGYSVYRGWDICGGAAEVARKFRPDVVLVHSGRMFDAAQAFSAVGIPSVIYVHNVLFEQWGDLGPHFETVGFIANSNFSARRVNEEFGVKCQVVPPVGRLDRYLCERTPTYLTMINPQDIKGVSIVLEIARARPDIPVLLVESWKLGETDIARLKARYEGLSNVRLVRSVSDMREIYSQTKLLVVPTVVEEAWGRVATEAQVSGIPVVARNIGGLPEAVGLGGILVDADGSTPSWVAAVSRLWDSSVDYATASASALANSKHLQAEADNRERILLDVLKMHVAKCRARN